MIEFRRAEERGHADHGWLKTYHSFSFADYYDPEHMGFGPLRVINDDWIEAGKGFGMHPHRNMEIVTYVLSGAIAHRDSMGHGETIYPHDIQRMSAGTGVLHSEFNPASDEATHLLQIWIEPKVQNVSPSYEQTSVPAEQKKGRLTLIAGPEGAPVTLHSSTQLYAALLGPEDRVEVALAPERLSYVHLARGTLRVNGHDLRAGDAVKLVKESHLVLDQGDEAEVLVFDLPPTRTS